MFDFGQGSELDQLWAGAAPRVP